MKIIKSILKNKRGAAAIEYGLLIGLIGLVIVVSLTDISTSLNNSFTTISSSFSTTQIP